MTQFNENYLDRELINKDADRKVISNPEDSQWGQLILPGRNENLDKTNEGLRLLIIASYRTGGLLVKALTLFEKLFPDKLNIIGLITDDPASTDARISVKKRIWRLFDNEQRLDMEDDIIEHSLQAGVPVYTGAVKTEYAHKLLKQWDPEAIQVFVFGQIIDSPFITYPDLGIYNYHPADLVHHHGAGPRPYVDLLERDAKTSRFTIHQLSEELDSGHVIGQSPVINVRNKDGSITDNLLIIEDKMTEPVDFMAIILTNELIKKKQTKQAGKIETLNFVNYFTKEHKEFLKQPITETKSLESMPEISGFALELLSKIK